MGAGYIATTAALRYLVINLNAVTQEDVALDPGIVSPLLCGGLAWGRKHWGRSVYMAS